MNDMSFASYILSEKSLAEKMKILMYFKRNHEMFFDNTVIFKTEICRMFLEHGKIEGIDHNLVLTACLVYGCKKTAIAFDKSKVKTYAEEGAKYLASLGFDEKFCKICLEVNRYKEEGIREKESDILELVDNFGMLLDRDDRRAFTPVEALFILEHENLQGKANQYLEDFKECMMELENLETLGLDRSKIITKWQAKINKLAKYDIVHGINLAIEYRTEEKKIYIEGKKLERNKDGIRDNKQKINMERRLQEELAKQVDQTHKFSDLLEGSSDENIS